MLRLLPLSLLLLGLPTFAQLDPGQPSVVPGGERLAPLVDVTLTATSVEPVALAFAPDGSGVLAVHADGSLSASGPQDAHPGWTHIGFGSQPGGIVPLDDGSFLLASQDGEVRRLTGDETARMIRGAGPVEIRAVAGDGQTVVLALADGTLEVRANGGANDGFQPWTSPHDSLVESLTVDAGRIGLGYQDGRVVRLDVDGGPDVGPSTYATLEAPVQALSWIPGSDALCALTRDGQLHEIDGEAHRSWDIPFAATDIRPTPDGEELLLLAPALGRVGFWDRSEGQLRAEDRMGPAPTASARAIALSPDGTTFVTASGPYLRWRRFHLDETRLRNSISEGPIPALSTGALSSDGSRLAIATEDGAVQLWDTRTGASAGLWLGAPKITALVFGPDRDTLAVARNSGQVELHSLARGSRTELRGRTPKLVARDLVFLPTGELLTGSDDGRLRVLGVPETNTPPIAAHEGACTTLAVARDEAGSTVLASGGDDGKVSIFVRDKDGKLQLDSTFDDEAPVVDVLLRANGSEVLSANATGLIHLRRIADGEVLRTFDPVGAAPRSMTLFASEERLLVTLADGALIRFSFTEELPPIPLARPSSAGVWIDAVAGDRFFVHATQGDAGQGGTVQLIEEETGRIVRRFPGDAGAVTVIASGTLGRYLAAASRDGWIRIWDLEEKRLTTLIEGHGGAATALGFRRDGKRLLTGGLEGELRIWEFPELRPKRIIHFSDQPVQTLRFLLEGKEAQVLAADGTVRQFELDGAATALMARKVFARVAVFAPDGERMACAEENTLRVRRATALNGEILREWQVEHPITALDWSGNGEWIVAGDQAGALLLFDPKGEGPSRLGSQAGPVASAVFSPGSDLVASLGSGSAVALWNVNDADSAGFLAGHDDTTTALAFVGDGSRLVTGGPAGRLRVWNVEERRIELELSSWDGPNWTLQERDGLLWHGTNGTVVERYREGVWQAHAMPPSEDVALSIEALPLRSDVNPRFGLLVTNAGSTPVHGLWVGGPDEDRFVSIGPWTHTRLAPGETAQLPVYVWPNDDGTWPALLVHHSGGSVSVDLPDDAFEH